MSSIVYAAPGDLSDFATGSGFTAADGLVSLFTGSIVALATIWICWILLGAWRDYSAGNGDGMTLTSIAFRGGILLALIGLLLNVF